MARFPAHPEQNSNHLEAETKKKKPTHTQWLEGAHTEARRSRELFVEHFKSSYNDFPKLPIWMLTELIRPRQRPVTNVVAMFVVAVTFLPVLAAYYLTREGEHTGGAGK